jgi:REP-associated tyrosine transposase
VSLLHAHPVVVTNYPRPVFTDAMLTFTQTTMGTVCAQLNAELVEFNGQADHVHLLVAYPPTPAISVLAQRLKGRTAYPVRREFAGVCVRARMRGHLCSPSSCRGAPLTIIKQHIDGQTRPLPTPGSARRQTRWAHPELKSQACAQELGHRVNQTRVAQPGDFTGLRQFI